jgi:hypothetical protein
MIIAARGIGGTLGFFGAMFIGRLDPRIGMTMGFGLLALSGVWLVEIDLEVGVADLALNSLVQGMATRLDAGLLLKSLGELWSEVRGVRGVLLLYRRPNGNWVPAFSKGLSAPEKWVHILEAHPDLAKGKRLRKHASFERLPFLEEMDLKPPFFLVPLAWALHAISLRQLRSTR